MAQFSRMPGETGFFIPPQELPNVAVKYGSSIRLTVVCLTQSATDGVQYV